MCFFSFLFMTQNVHMGRVRESQRWLRCTHGQRYESLVKTSDCLDQNLPGYIKSQMPTQILMVTPSAYNLYNACDHPSFYHTTHAILWHFQREHQHPVYFRYLVHILLFCFQYLTSAAASIDVKGVFKSISNKC